jgi:hypothetical protein
MTKERSEIGTEKHQLCPICRGIARYIETDYFYSINNVKTIWTKLYRCNDCGEEYLKEINSLLG